MGREQGVATANARVPAAVRLTRRTGAFAIAAIVVLNVGLGALQFFGNLATVTDGSWAALIDVNVEQSIPTWLSTLLLAASAATAAGVAHTRPTNDAPRRWWWLLAGVFGLASLDEAVSLHERLIVPVRQTFDLDGALYSAWVVPGLVIAAALAIAFTGFARSLPPGVRWRFVGGAMLFIGGALGFEMAGALAFRTLGSGVLSGTMAIVEETLELAGAVLWLEAMLLRFIGRPFGVAPPPAWREALI